MTVPVWRSPLVSRVGRRGLADERLGDEALRQTARAASICALARRPPPRPRRRSRRQVAASAGLRNSSPGARRPSAGQVHLGGRGPLVLEQLAHRLDGRADALHRGVPVLGVPDGVPQHVGEGLGAVVAQQQHPGVEGAGHGGGERAGAGDEVEAEPAVVRDGRPGRGAGPARTAPARRGVGGGEDDRDLAGGPVEVRLDDVQHEAGGDGRVVGVAAVLQDGHRRLRGEPVGGGRPCRRCPGGWAGW